MHTQREICGGLAGCEGKLRHLGIPRAPKRSTLAYADEHRPWQLFATVLRQLPGKCRAEVAGRGSRTEFGGQRRGPAQASRTELKALP